MKKIFLLLTICILSMNALYALDDSNMTEAEIQIEAQKDLAAFLQYSVKYRFSHNLTVGDKIEYKLTNDPYEETDISIEVTKKDKDGVWIVEKFDDIEVHMLVNLDNMELIDYFGYDEGEIIPDPPLITEDEMINRINIMNNVKNNLGMFSIPEDWKNSQRNEMISTKSGNFNCITLKPLVSEGMVEKIGDAKKAKEVVESLKLYFSEDVPKLIPFEIAKYALGSKEVFEKIPGGFVKNSVIEIKELHKE